jgi:hypothetical protein
MEATVLSLYRAVTTSPDPLPDLDLGIQLDDIAFPHPSLWSLDRPIGERGTWLVPDFGFFSWPETYAGSWRDFLCRAERVEAGLQWADKRDKLVRALRCRRLGLC